jgi:hypothetical protein
MKLFVAAALLFAPLFAVRAAESDVRLYNIRPPEHLAYAVTDPVAQRKIEAFQRALGPGGLLNVQWDAVANQFRAISFAPPLPQPELRNSIERARAFVLANPDLFGLSTEALEAMTAELEVREPDHETIRFTQIFNGIPFVEQQGVLRVLVAPTGIVAANGHYARNAPTQTSLALNVSDAYRKMREQVPNFWKTPDGGPSTHDGATGAVSYEADPRLADVREGDPARQLTLIRHVGMDLTDELTARLSYFMDGPQPRLVWQFNMKGTQARFEQQPTYIPAMTGVDVLVDAENGKVLYAVAEREYPPMGIGPTP